MFATQVDTFAAGDYGQTTWYCSDAIARTANYRVIKRTPKRVTVMEIYPSREHGPYTYAIKTDESGEYFMPDPVIGAIRPLRPETERN